MTSVLHSLTRGARAVGVGVDADDADLGDPVLAGARAGGFEVDEGERGGEEAHRGRSGA